MSALFVTGTGTEIGKTFVSAALIAEFRRRGRRVDVLKPVASGVDESSIAVSDPGILLEALGEAITSAELDRITPWRFKAPLSPDMAAQREDRTLDFAALVNFCRERIRKAEGTLLIEGVGGIMVPLDERHTVLDWISALCCPVLLVAGSYLGAISHSLTALDVLQRRGLDIAALVVNETPGSTVPLDETAATVARFAGPLPVAVLPRLPGSASPHDAIARLADLIALDRLDRRAPPP